MSEKGIDEGWIHNFMLTVERIYINKLLAVAEEEEFYYCILGAYENDDNERTNP